MIATRHGVANDFEMLSQLGRRAFYEAFGSYNDPADMENYLDKAFDASLIKEQLLKTGCNIFNRLRR